MSNYKISILHLYPDLLNLYGDKGNIECMRKRLEWRGIDAKVIMCMADMVPDFSNADIVFLGGGNDREQKIVCEKLKSKKQELKNFVESGGSLVAVCGGYEMLGRYLYANDQKIDGLGVLDIYTEVNHKSRFIGDIVLECDGLKNKVVGFENHRGSIKTGDHIPFGKVIIGNGNDGISGCEGVVYKNVTATYLHGPLLPKNPELCDRILLNALQHKFPEYQGLLPLDDGIEILANEYMINRTDR